MADAKKRIILYQEKTTVDNSDYVLMDSSANGTNKYQVTRILTEAEAAAQAKVDAEAAAREAADNELKDDLRQYKDIFTGNVDESVQNWLDEHPEATTTVQDGSITEAKFASIPNLETKSKNLVGAINEVNDFTKDKIMIIPIASLATGDATVIIFPNGKSCLIDSNDGNNVDNAVIALVDNNITHLDYCMVSHYHGDHINGFLSTKLDSYINSETVFFLPEDVPSTKTDLYNSMVALKSKLNTFECEIVQPNVEKQIYSIEDYCYFEFYNVSHAAYYASEPFIYNNCSLCTKLHFYQNTAFFTGDIGALAQERLCGTVGNVSIYKAQHHGSDNFQNVSWLEEVNPDIVYCCASSENETDNLLKRQFVVQMAKMGKSVYSTSNNGNFLIEMSATESNAFAKSIGVDNEITSLDMLLGADTYDQVFSNATLQTLVDAIPFNTEFDFSCPLSRIPNLFNGLGLNINSNSTSFQISGCKFYNNYFVVKIIDILLGTVFLVPIGNGTVATSEIKTYNMIKYKEIDCKIESVTQYGRSKSFDVTGAQKILSANFIYDDAFYHFLMDDQIIPVLSIRPSETLITIFCSGGTSNTERTLKVRLAYIPTDV